MIASLPAAGHIFVLAQRCRAGPERVSAVIVTSTVISVVTVPFVAWLVLESSTLATLLLIAECNEVKKIFIQL